MRGSTCRAVAYVIAVLGGLGSLIIALSAEEENLLIFLYMALCVAGVFLIFLFMASHLENQEQIIDLMYQQKRVLDKIKTSNAENTKAKNSVAKQKSSDLKNWTCPYCGTENDKEATYCKKCLIHKK